MDVTAVDTAPFERHTLPTGTEIFYRDSDHSYWSEIQQKAGAWTGIRAARLAGVTTVIKPFDFNPDRLLAWAARLTREGIAALATEHEEMPDWLFSADTIEAALEDARLRYTDARDDAATRGTNVHLLALHALASGRPVPDFTGMTTEEVGYARGVAGWWLDENPQVLASEFLVADLELGVAGRPDLLCRLRDGRLAIVDAKTSGYISAKFAVQLSGYSRLAVLSGYDAPEVGVVLRVTPEGDFNALEVTLDDADFLAALDVYRRAARIQGELRRAAK